MGKKDQSRRDLQIPKKQIFQKIFDQSKKEKTLQIDNHQRRFLKTKNKTILYFLIEKKENLFKVTD